MGIPKQQEPRDYCFSIEIGGKHLGFANVGSIHIDEDAIIDCPGVFVKSQGSFVEMKVDSDEIANRWFRQALVSVPRGPTLIYLCNGDVVICSNPYRNGEYVGFDVFKTYYAETRRRVMEGVD